MEQRKITLEALYHFARAVSTFLAQYQVAYQHNTEREAYLKKMEKWDAQGAALAELTGFVATEPLWTALHNEYLKFRGSLATSYTDESQQKNIKHIIFQMDSILPIIEANSGPIVLVMNPSKRYGQSQREYM
jgi:hypothetical protein